jgi:hypothetical protein
MEKKAWNSGNFGGKKVRKKNGHFYFIMIYKHLCTNTLKIKEACPEKGWPLLTYEKHLITNV